MITRNLFFDDGEETNNNPPPPPPETKEAKPPESKEDQGVKKARLAVKLSPDQQSYVNSLIAEEKRKTQNTTEQLILNLETQKNLASTSTAEREALETRIESLRAEFTTKEELQKKDSEKKLKEEKSAREKAEKESKDWKDKFIEDRIRTAIISGAAEHRAYDPEQIYAILRPKTRLVDVLGEDNKPTGDFTPRAKIEGKGQDGPTQLDLVVSEAIKVMTEMPEKYGNLFNSGGTGGLGALAPSGRRNGASSGPPENPEDYIAWRKKRGKTSV